MEDKVVIPQGARTATFQSSEVEVPVDCRGGIFFLRINSASGTTPTCVVKIQNKDPLSGQWVDVQLGTFASKTTTNTDTLDIYPGVTAVASRRVSGLLGKTIRAVATIGGTTPSFDLSLSVNFMK